MRNFSHMTRCSSCRRRWPRDRSGLRQQNARQMRSKGALPRHFWTIYAAFCSAAVTTSVYAKGFDTALTFVCTFQHWHMTLCTHATATPTVPDPVVGLAVARRTPAGRSAAASPVLAALLQDIAAGAGGSPSATDGASLAGAAPRCTTLPACQAMHCHITANIWQR